MITSTALAEGIIPAYIYSTPPREALLHLSHCCKVAIGLVNRRSIPVDARRELLATWKYIASFVRYVQASWSSRGVDQERQQLYHLHNTMLPRLLAHNVYTTTQQLTLYSRHARTVNDWHRVWRSLSSSRPAGA